MNLHRCVFFFLVFFGGDGLLQNSSDEDEDELDDDEEELRVLFGGRPGFLFGGRSLAPTPTAVTPAAEAAVIGGRQLTGDNGMDFCLALLLLLLVVVVMGLMSEEWLTVDRLMQCESSRTVGGDGLMEERLEIAGSNEEPPDSYPGSGRMCVRSQSIDGGEGLRLEQIKAL
jgi:hypothetical protein